MTLDPDQSDIRELWMPPQLVQDLLRKDPNRPLDFAASVKGYLKQFIIGKRVDNCWYMKSWSMDIFEFRVSNIPNKSQWRIFGGFGDLDKFVAFNHRPRSYFDHPKSEERWAAEIAKAVDGWDEYFPGVHRVRSRPFSNCVTNGDDIPREECA